jgi:hypothetical protein
MSQDQMRLVSGEPPPPPLSAPGRPKRAFEQLNRGAEANQTYANPLTCAVAGPATTARPLARGLACVRKASCHPLVSALVEVA